MARIVIKPIPRKKFDARVNRSMVKGSLPNHYPNTRVTLMENRIKNLEENPVTIDIDDQVTEESPNAVKSSGIWAALQALLQSVTQALAKLFIPTKTSELENDSNFITSSSLTKANIEGLKDTDSPTFADTLIPALADPASYDPATVAYLTELFGELSDSVKESILRTWGRLQDITNKVAGLQGGGNIETIASQLTEQQYEQIPLASFDRLGSVGSGALTTSKHRYLYIRTGETANSSFYARTSRLASGYFPGVAYTQIIWDNDMVLAFRGHVVSPANMTENSKRWIILGANETASVADPTYKSIGIRSDRSTMYGIVHDGMTLTEVDLGINYNGASLRDVVIKFYAGVRIDWYVNGALKGTSTNIPEGIGVSAYNTFGVSITNGVDAVNNLIMINDFKFWAQQ